MSAIAALLQMDAAPLPPSSITPLLDELDFGHDEGPRSWQGHAIALGQRSFPTTIEGDEAALDGSLAAGEQLPLVVADARLDNRDELIAALQPQLRVELRGASESLVIAAAYKRWGSQFPQRLLGDFAFVLWDERRQRLLAARDPMGIRQLHYARRGGRLLLASTIGAVLRGLPQQPSVNESLALRFLTHTCAQSVGQTLFREVLRLPAGHQLLACREKMAVDRFAWVGERAPEGCHRDEDYIERYRELLQEATVARLRARGPVHIHVSGGLDSSSVACLAHAAVIGGEAAVPMVRLQACIYPRFTIMDERSYQRPVMGRCREFTPLWLDAESFTAMSHFADDQRYPFHQPETHPQRPWLIGNLQAARAHQARVLISGIGGDFALAAHLGYGRANLAAAVVLGGHLGEWRHFRRRQNWANLIWRGLALPQLERLMPGLAQRYRLRKSWYRAPWVHRGALSRAAAANDPPPLRLSPLGPLGAAGRAIHEFFFSGQQAVYACCNDVDARYCGVEWRHPFHDRRLVEFMMHVPAHLLVRAGWDKYIARRALRGTLPEEVRERRTNVDSWALVEAGLRRQAVTRIRGLTARPRISSHGWVDSTGWREAWEDFIAGREDDYQVLMDAAQIEAWLRYNNL